MRKAFVALLATLLVFVGGISHATITETNGTNILTLTLDGTTNWDSATNFSDLTVQAIMFVPSAASDVLVVRENSATGPEVMSVTVTAASDTRIVYFPRDHWGKPLEIHLFIKATDLTLGTAANARVIIFK